MKKVMLLMIICSLILNVYSEKYAILVSAGKATADDVFSNSEYWYDLFSAYEDLILNEGYSHENVYVFYGDGIDFTETNYDRYKANRYGWSNGIVDFPNDYSTLYNEIGNLGALITNEDKLHIRWVVGHGSNNSMDEYNALIQNRNQSLSLDQILYMFNQISNYKERIIFWMTCRAGCIKEGNKSFNNAKTTIITSSDWNENSYGYFHPAETNHAEMNYVLTSFLFGEDPLGVNYDADLDNNYKVSINELFDETKDHSIMSSNVNLGDISGISDNTYLGGKNNLATKILLLD